MAINKGIKQSTTVEVIIINFVKFVSNKKSCNFLIFCPILTNFLPKCRAENVYSEKGHIAGEKGMTLVKEGIVKVARGNTNPDILLH